MIGSWRSKALKKFHETGSKKGIDPRLAKKIALRLDVLDRSRVAQDMALPGHRLHQLRGDLEGFWSVDVSGNWRIIFRFEDGQALEVDLRDTH